MPQNFLSKRDVFKITPIQVNKPYGWNKFIVVVPSIAIREGVYKSLKITAERLYYWQKKMG